MYTVLSLILAAATWALAWRCLRLALELRTLARTGTGEGVGVGTGRARATDPPSEQLSHTDRSDPAWRPDALIGRRTPFSHTPKGHRNHD